MLEALQYYLGFIKYLQNYIHFYTQLVAPLQVLKMPFFYHAPIRGQQRRAYDLKTKFGPPAPQKHVSFLSIQNALSWLFTLVHYNPEKIFWMDLDISKKFGFRAIIFYTAANKTLS